MWSKAKFITVCGISAAIMLTLSAVCTQRGQHVTRLYEEGVLKNGRVTRVWEHREWSDHLARHSRHDYRAVIDAPFGDETRQFETRLTFDQFLHLKPGMSASLLVLPSGEGPVFLGTFAAAHAAASANRLAVIFTALVGLTCAVAGAVVASGIFPAGRACSGQPSETRADAAADPLVDERSAWEVA